MFVGYNALTTTACLRAWRGGAAKLAARRVPIHATYFLPNHGASPYRRKTMSVACASAWQNAHALASWAWLRAALRLRPYCAIGQWAGRSRLHASRHHLPPHPLPNMASLI